MGDGNVNSVEWNDGMERWSGLLEWSIGLDYWVPRPQNYSISYTLHVHCSMASYLEKQLKNRSGVPCQTLVPRLDQSEKYIAK